MKRPIHGRALRAHPLRKYGTMRVLKFFSLARFLLLPAPLHKPFFSPKEHRFNFSWEIRVCLKQPPTF
jgi:hypothetical protein